MRSVRGTASPPATSMRSRPAKRMRGPAPRAACRIARRTPAPAAPETIRPAAPAWARAACAARWCAPRTRYGATPAPPGASVACATTAWCTARARPTSPSAATKRCAARAARSWCAPTTAPPVSWTSRSIAPRTCAAPIVRGAWCASGTRAGATTRRPSCLRATKSRIVRRAGNRCATRTSGSARRTIARGCSESAAHTFLEHHQAETLEARNAPCRRIAHDHDQLGARADAVDLQVGDAERCIRRDEDRRGVEVADARIEHDAGAAAREVGHTDDVIAEARQLAAAGAGAQCGLEDGCLPRDRRAGRGICGAPGDVVLVGGPIAGEQDERGEGERIDAHWCLRELGIEGTTQGRERDVNRLSIPSVRWPPCLLQ